MLGPAVNALAIVVFSLIGRFLIKGIPARFEYHLKKSLGIVIAFVGLRGAMDGENALLLVISLILGGALGELIDIDKWMNSLGLWAQGKLARSGDASALPGGKENTFAKGFVSASVLFCAGSMAILGSMQSGMQGNHEILFTKSILDATMSLVFGATLGIGAAFSAIPVFLYQGGIALASMAVGGYLSEEMIREMSAVGSLVIAGIGFNFLGVKEIKVANLIPAVFVPILWLALAGALG